MHHPPAQPPVPRIARPRRGTLVLLALVLASCITSCERQPATEPFIAVVGAGQDHPLWPVIAGTARQEDMADLAGPPIRIVAPRQTSVNEQMQIVQSLYEAGMKALCIQVIDPQASERILDSLADRGVVVVTMVRPAGTANRIFHCSWRERDLGESLSHTLDKALPAGGHIVVLAAAGSEEDEAQPQRLSSATLRLKSFPKLQVLETVPCGSGAAARTAMVETAERYPTLRGWLSMGNWPAQEGFLADPPCHALLRPDDGRVLVMCDPYPETWPALNGSARIHVVCPNYGEIAPEAISIARSLFYGSGSPGEDGKIDVLSFAPDQLPMFTRAWKRWVEGP